MSNPDYNKRVCDVCGKEDLCQDVIRHRSYGIGYGEEHHYVICNYCRISYNGGMGMTIAAMSSTSGE